MREAKRSACRYSRRADCGRDAHHILITRAYGQDLRERIVRAVDDGASRIEASVGCATRLHQTSSAKASAHAGCAAASRIRHTQRVPGPLLRAYAGSGLVIRCFARCNRTPGRLSVARTVSPVTRSRVIPSPVHTTAARSSVQTLVGLPNVGGESPVSVRRRPGRRRRRSGEDGTTPRSGLPVPTG
jgi:hypothetical protein